MSPSLKLATKGKRRLPAIQQVHRSAVIGRASYTHEFIGLIAACTASVAHGTNAREMAAVLACGVPAAVSRHGAAMLSQIIQCDSCDPVDVIVQPGRVRTARRTG